MSYSPIAFIAPNYRDYPNYWLKAYEPATTTTKPIALDSNGDVQVAKLKLNADGFFVSAGQAISMPYIDGRYDAYLFPTEVEADANDTSNAIRVADGILGVNGETSAADIMTLQQAIENTSAQEGDYVRISDRDNALFIYKATGTVDQSTTIESDNGLFLTYEPESGIISAKACGVVSGVDSAIQIQAAQDLSDKLKIPVSFKGVSQVIFSGRLLFDSYLEWHGSGRYETTFYPLTLTRAELGGIDWVAKRDTTVSVTHFLIQDLGFNGRWDSGPFVLENLISMFRVEANGSHDRDITALRCHFINPPHEGLVLSVATTAVGVSSGGYITGARMLFCSGDVVSLAGAGLGSNMFKTIHGSIDQPGLYGEYPISDIRSFGNTCRGWRSLSDFKRGTANFTHNNSYVEDMSDVQSISVDGVKDGTIGPANTGKLIARSNGKNFYEIQGVDINIMGGTCDLANKAGVIGGMVVTDYAYPAENGDGVGNRGNQSININTYGFTARNVPFHAVRLLNTKDCYTSGVVAENCAFEAVSHEGSAGKVDINGSDIIPSGNRANNIRSINCRATVSNLATNPTVYGENITNENGQYDIFNASVGSYTFTQLNINKNENLTDYSGGASPLFWTGAAAYVATGQAEYSPSSFSLEDVSNSALQFKTYDSFVPATHSDIFYFQLLVRSGTAPSQSILIQQFDSSDIFLSSTFIPLLATANWESRLNKFTTDEVDCSYIKISLVPAGQSASDVSNTGTSFFSDVYFGIKPKS